MWMAGETEEDRESEELMPVLAVADQSSDWIGAWVVPDNEGHCYAIKALVGHIEDVGCTQVILNSDQEPAIMMLQAAAQREMSVFARHRKWGSRIRWGASVYKCKSPRGRSRH